MPTEPDTCLNLYLKVLDNLTLIWVVEVAWGVLSPTPLLVFSHYLRNGNSCKPIILQH